MPLSDISCYNLPCWRPLPQQSKKAHIAAMHPLIWATLYLLTSWRLCPCHLRIEIQSKCRRNPDNEKWQMLINTRCECRPVTRYRSHGNTRCKWGTGFNLLGQWLSTANFMANDLTRAQSREGSCPGENERPQHMPWKAIHVGDTSSWIKVMVNCLLELDQKVRGSPKSRDVPIKFFLSWSRSEQLNTCNVVKCVSGTQ